MMNREQLISILGALDTPTLVKALSVTGINIAPEQMDSELMVEEDPQEKWNDIKISLDKSPKPPIHNPGAYLLPPKQPMPYQPMGMNAAMQQPVPNEMAEYE